MRQRQRRHDDRGVTLVVAVFVAAVALSLSLVAMSVAVTTQTDSGVDRQRTVALHAAEAGLDITYAALENAAGTLPCPTTLTVRGFPDTPQVQTAIQYYAGSSPVPCGSAVRADKAVITATATAASLSGAATRGRRVMQSTVLLDARSSDPFRSALYGSAGVTMQNRVTLLGSQSADADLYTNGSFSCANNQNYGGSVYAQGTITFAGTCSAEGDLHAGTSVTTTGPSALGGSVVASTGAASLHSSTTVAGNVTAAGDISWASCATTTKCFRSTSSPPPPAMPFPILRGNDAAVAQWTNAGYTVHRNNDCSLASGSRMNVATTTLVNLIKTPSAWSGPVLYASTCPIQFVGTGTLALPAHLAVLSTGGFSSSQQVRFESTTTAERKLHWIVPHESAPSTWPGQPCATPGITTEQLFSTAGNVNLFLYTPCNITLGNQGTVTGQIYSGSTLTVTNNFTLTYTAVPVQGLDRSNLPPTSYKVSITNKREVR